MLLISKCQCHASSISSSPCRPSVLTNVISIHLCAWKHCLFYCNENITGKKYSTLLVCIWIYACRDGDGTYDLLRQRAGQWLIVIGGARWRSNVSDQSDDTLLCNVNAIWLGILYWCDDFKGHPSFYMHVIVSVRTCFIEDLNKNLHKYAHTVMYVLLAIDATIDELHIYVGQWWWWSCDRI